MFVCISWFVQFRFEHAWGLRSFSIVVLKLCFQHMFLFRSYCVSLDFMLRYRVEQFLKFSFYFTGSFRIHLPSIQLEFLQLPVRENRELAVHNEELTHFLNKSTLTSKTMMLRKRSQTWLKTSRSILQTIQLQVHVHVQSVLSEMTWVSSHQVLVHQCLS